MMSISESCLPPYEARAVCSVSEVSSQYQELH